MLSYAEKRERHLCSRARCRRRAEDFTKCSRHRARDREIQRRRTQLAEACGLCTRCKFRAAGEDGRRCGRCERSTAAPAVATISISPPPSKLGRTCSSCATPVSDSCERCARCVWSGAVASWKASRAIPAPHRNAIRYALAEPVERLMLVPEHR